MLVKWHQSGYSSGPSMAKKFRARLDILPPAQRRLWDELGSVPANFVLYGGTALALQLGHRQSEDFDFFAASDIDPGKLHSSLPFLHDARTTQQEPGTLTCLVERGGPVKVSFFGMPNLVRIRPPLVSDGNGVKIASLLDIAGTKASARKQRTTSISML